MLKSKDRDVTIVAYDDGSGIKLRMEYGGGPTNALKFDKNDDEIDGKKMRKRDHYRILFNLRNEPPVTGVTFPNGKWTSKRRAMWVMKTDPANPGCPTSSQYLGQFEATDVTPTTLTVVNKDDDVETLAFTLRCLKPGGNQDNPQDYIELDPIADNKNGGVSGEDFVASDTGTVILIGVGVIAIGALIYLSTR